MSENRSGRVTVDVDISDAQRKLEVIRARIAEAAEMRLVVDTDGLPSVAHDDPPMPLDVVARQVAEVAHRGQVDKLGQPYIGHVGRVAHRLGREGDRAVAWLHDALEDTDVSLTSLRFVNPFSADWEAVVEDVQRLTHRPNEPRSDYYARIRTSDRAVRVKLADIADNTDPDRMAQLDEVTRSRLTAKYAKAIALLTSA